MGIEGAPCAAAGRQSGRGQTTPFQTMPSCADGPTAQGTTMTSKLFGTRLASVLAPAAAGLAFLAATGDAEAFKLDGPPKIAFIYASAAQDGGWDEALENRPQGGPGPAQAARRRDREHPRRSDQAPRGDRSLCEARLQHHRRHDLRLQRADRRSGEGLSERRLPQRLRHHQRPEPRELLRPHLSGLVSRRHRRRRRHQVEEDRHDRRLPRRRVINWDINSFASAPSRSIRPSRRPPSTPIPGGIR